VEVERIIERFVEVPVDRIVEVPKIVEVERVVEKLVEVPVYVDKIVEKEVRRRPAAPVRATRGLSGRECADQSSCPLSLRELAHASAHAFACARSELDAKGLLDQHYPTNKTIPAGTQNCGSRADN
jgi:hypothetical protein